MPQMPPNPMMGGMPPPGGPATPPQGGQGMPPPQAPPQEEPVQSQQEVEAENAQRELDRLLQSANLTDQLDEDELLKLGEKVVKGWEIDTKSRQSWEEGYDTWLKMTAQYREHKNFPWKGASNVKFPLLSTAAMQFQARAYPTLVPSDGQVVRCRVRGVDKDGKKAALAQEIAELLSDQVMIDMPGWEEDMDKLLFMLPIAGCAFKKTWYDRNLKKVCSNLVHAKDLVVNHWTKDLQSAERVTQEFYWNKREIEERIKAGVFRKLELPDSLVDLTKNSDSGANMSQPTGEYDEATPYLVLEQHTWFDVDGDKYPEPVIITVLQQTKEVLRIQARWYSEGMDKDGTKTIRITPINYYTKFPFIPNPDGGFYDLGWGQLLGPLNEAVNTLVNQLVDAGSLSNLQSGFLAKGLRIKIGDNKFAPGEWKPVNAMGDDLKKSIFPLPVREPSSVLFQLLGMLINSVKELSSVAEIMTGKMPGQNTPAYTVKESVEQGQKVFTAVYKRVYRALTEEFQKVYKLNYVYNEDEELAPLYEQAEENIIPAADPQAQSVASKGQKAELLAKMIQLGVERQKVVERMLESMEIPNWRELLPDPNKPPPKSPEVQKMEMQGQMEEKKMEAQSKIEQQKLQAEMQMQQQEHELKLKEMQAELQQKQQLFQLEVQKVQLELQALQQKLGVQQKTAEIQAQSKMMQTQVDVQSKQAQSQADVQAAQQKHAMGLEQGAQAHEQKMTQQKEAQKNAASKPSGTSGVAK